MYRRSHFSQKSCTHSCTYLKLDVRVSLEERTPIRFVGNVELEGIKKEGEIASQYSILELT